MFTDSELAFLRDYAHKYALKEPERLADAVHLVAHLGGYRSTPGSPDHVARHTSAALGHQIGREIGFRDGQRHA